MDVVKFVDMFAVNHQQEWHKEALQTYGERIIIRQIWTVKDFMEGRVTRCLECQPGGIDQDQSVKARIAEVYKQAGETYCSSCFGVGFTGGFRPVIYVSYILSRSVPRDEDKNRSGVMYPEGRPTQFLWEPALNEGDLVVRVTEWEADEVSPKIERSRWILTEIDRNSLRTGLGYPGDSVQVSQRATIDALPPSHPYWDVPVRNDGNPPERAEVS